MLDIIIDLYCGFMYGLDVRVYLGNLIAPYIDGILYIWSGIGVFMWVFLAIGGTWASMYEKDGI